MVVAALFAQVAGFNYVFWDDYATVVWKEPLTQEWKTAADALWVLRVDNTMRFMPVTWLSYKAVLAVWGMSPGAMHALNLVLHTACAVLLYMALRRLRPEGETLATATLAAVMALAWAVNPLRAEPVAWVTDLPYALATAFLLASFLLYLQGGRAAPWTTARRAGMAGAVLLFLLSMSTYPLGLTWPVALPLITLAFGATWPHPGRAGWMKELRRQLTVPAVMLVPAVLVIAITVHDRATYTTEYFSPAQMAAVEMKERLAHAVVAPPYFAYKFLCPFDLSPAHYAECDLLSGPLKIFIGAFWAAGLWLLWQWRTRWRALCWLGAYVLVCVPVMNLTEAVLLPPDRYAYLANLVMLLGIYDGLTTSAKMERRRWAVGAAIGAAVVFWMGLTWAQLAVWTDSYTLLAYLEAQPCTQEHEDLRYQLLRMKAGQQTMDGYYAEALANYLDYAQHRGVDAKLLHQIGLDYFSLGQYAQALPYLERANQMGTNPTTQALIAATKEKLAAAGDAAKAGAGK